MEIRHLITKYEEGGSAWAEAWVQIDLLGRCWCLWRKRILIGPTLPDRCPAMSALARRREPVAGRDGHLARVADRSAARADL